MQPEKALKILDMVDQDLDFQKPEDAKQLVERRARRKLAMYHEDLFPDEVQKAEARTKYQAVSTAKSVLLHMLEDLILRSDTERVDKAVEAHLKRKEMNDGDKDEKSKRGLPRLVAVKYVKVNPADMALQKGKDFYVTSTAKLVTTCPDCDGSAYQIDKCPPCVDCNATGVRVTVVHGVFVTNDCPICMGKKRSGFDEDHFCKPCSGRGTVFLEVTEKMLVPPKAKEKTVLKRVSLPKEKSSRFEKLLFILVFTKK